MDAFNRLNRRMYTYGGEEDNYEEKFNSLWYCLSEDEDILVNIADKLQEYADAYNIMIKDDEMDKDDMDWLLRDMIGDTAKKYYTNEYSRVLSILLMALRGREKDSDIWHNSAYIAFREKDFELCRELVFLAGKSNIYEERKSMMALCKESKDENVADILGMVVEELKSDGITEAQYEAFLVDFGKFLNKWRSLDIPKAHKRGSYKLVYEFVENCFKHKAYHTALKLSGLLYSADRSKDLDHLWETNLLLGKVLYELEYLEEAKQCFDFADFDTDGECWDGEEEKYHALLEQETKMIIPREYWAYQEKMLEKPQKGEIRLYTMEELDKYVDGELEINFPENVEAHDNRADSERAERDGKALLESAKEAEKAGREMETAAYLFRVYILFGQEYLVKNAGEAAWEQVSAYL